MPFSPGVFTLGIAKSDSAVPPANDIASMTFNGTRTVFNGTLAPPEYPEEGDAVRVTVTGLISIPANFGPATVTFQLFFPDNLEAPIGQKAVTFPLPADNAATTRTLFMEFLLTFRHVDTTPNFPFAEVYADGMIFIGDGTVTQNYLLGRKVNDDVDLRFVGNVNVRALLTNPINPPFTTVVFDQCIIEYLELSEFFEPTPNPTPSP